MELFTKWLIDHVALLSAGAAAVTIIGLTYAGLRHVLSPVVRRTSLPALKREQGGGVAGAAPRNENDAPPAAPLKPTLHDDHVSLAVLRFEALSQNDDDKILASGIALEVIALITPVPDIRVCSRNTTMQWGSDAAGMREAAEQFNASFALSGHLQRVQDRVRIIARLTDIRFDKEVWTQTYDRNLEDVFTVQNEIARAIVGEILGQVRLSETLLSRKTAVQDLDAWGLLHKAYYFWLTNFSLENVDHAIAYLRRAVALAPDYPAPRAALAMLLTQQITNWICADDEAAIREASEMIDGAYRMAPNDIDVLENAGVVWQNIGQGSRAIMALRHCVELAPLNLISRGYLAMTLAFTRGEDGAREAKQLLEENFAIAPKHPSVPYWHWFTGIAEQGLGNYAQSIERCTKSLQGQPHWVHTHFFLANAHCVLGDVPAARQHFAWAVAINPAVTPRRYLNNLNRITGSDALSAPFVRGLLDANLID
jgi:adenylate cyclase